jgi:hypothetical protein
VVLPEQLGLLGENEKAEAFRGAAAAGLAGVVQALLLSGARTDVADTDGRTVFFLAVTNGHADVVTILLEAGGAEVSTCGEWSRTALHVAAERGHVDLVALLLEHDARMYLWPMARPPAAGCGPSAGACSGGSRAARRRGGRGRTASRGRARRATRSATTRRGGCGAQSETSRPRPACGRRRSCTRARTPTRVSAPSIRGCTVRTPFAPLSADEEAPPCRLAEHLRAGHHGGGDGVACGTNGGLAVEALVTKEFSDSEISGKGNKSYT